MDAQMQYQLERTRMLFLVVALPSAFHDELKSLEDLRSRTISRSTSDVVLVVVRGIIMLEVGEVPPVSRS
jgi:hypothetical protein